jgi:uncharacterized protein involved in outer membrane biogenesis
MKRVAKKVGRYRKPLIGLGILALIVLVGGLGAPLFVKADRYRPEIEAKLSEALGLKAVIDKDIDFRLLPSPAVTLRGLKIKAAEGAERPDVVDLRKARVEVSLLKLVQGRIAFQAIQLDGLTVTLETLSDGTPAWLPGKGQNLAAVPAQEQEGAAAKPATSSGSKSPGIEINHLQMSNATVVVLDGISKAESRIDNIGVNVDAGSMMGPYRFSGQAQLMGQTMLLSGGLEEVRQDRASPLNIEFALPEPNFKARFAGLLTLLSGGYTARGKMLIEAPSLEGLARSLGIAKGLAPDPVHIESTLTASANTFSLEDTRIELAGGKGYGKLKLVVGGESRIEARLDMDKLDLDRLTPREGATQPAAAGAKETKVAAKGDIPQPVSSSPSEPAPAKPVQLPDNLSGLIDLKVGLVRWNSQNLEQVRLDAALNSGELTVSQASLQLPDNGEAAFFGFVNNVPGGMKFEGTLEAQSPKIRSTLAWLGSEPKFAPDSRFRNFRLKASVQGTSHDIRLTNLDVMLDESRLLGAAILKPGKRPALGLALDLNRLDLDSYLTGPSKQTAPASDANGDETAPPAQPAAKVAPAPAKSQASPFAALSGFDANLRLTANNVLWRKTPLNRVLIDAALLNGELKFNDAGIGDVAGSSLHLKGGVDGLEKGVPAFKKLTAEISTRQPGALAQLLGGNASALDDLGPLGARITLDGGVDGLDLSGAVNAMGGDSRFDGKVANPMSATPALQGRLAVRHPNAAQLFKQAGNWGPFEATSLIDATATKVGLKDLVLNLGKGKIEGSAEAALSGARPQITAKLSGGEIDLDAYLPKKQAAAGRHGMPLMASLPVQLAAIAVTSSGSHWSNAAIDLGGLKSVDAKADIALAALRVSGVRLAKPLASLDLKDGVLTVPKFTAGLWGGALDAQAKLVAGTGLQIESKAILNGADLKSTLSELAGLSQAAGKYDAQFHLSAQGRSQAELVSRLNGDGGFAAKDGVVEGIDLPAVNRQLSNLNNVASFAGLAATVQGGGKTAFSQMSASFRANNGVVTSNDIKLIADGGQGSGTMAADLPQWSQDARLSFKLSGIANGPSLGLRLQGPLDAPRKFIDIDDLQRWAVEKGLMKGLKGKGLDGLLGGGSSSQQPAQQGSGTPSDQQPPEKTSKKLRNILKGL